jgi:hypothetical protein
VRGDRYRNPAAWAWARLDFPNQTRKMTAEAGFSHFTTRDFENPINAYYEVRP